MEALAGESNRLVADGENANALWSDLTRSALGYARCRVPVNLLCGGADIATNPMLHAGRAAWHIPGARLRWLHGYGHMLHHFRPDAVVDAARAVAERAGRTRREPDHRGTVRASRRSF